LSGFDGTSETGSNRYKLFNEDVLRKVVLNRLVLQMTQCGLCRPDPKVTLCLAAGNIYNERDEIAAIFEDHGWNLWDSEWLQEELRVLSESDYEDSIEAIVTKILLRK
jgi:hypothetical protein